MGNIHPSKQFVSFAIEKELVDQVQVQADQMGVSRSAALRAAVLQFLSDPLPVDA